MSRPPLTPSIVATNGILGMLSTPLCRRISGKVHHRGHSTAEGPVDKTCPGSGGIGGRPSQHACMQSQIYISIPTPSSLHLYPNTIITTSLSQHHHHYISIPTPSSLHIYPNTIITTSLSQHHYRYISISTPLSLDLAISVSV